MHLSSCCLFGPLVGFLSNGKNKQTTAKYHPPSAADPSLPCLGLSRCSHQTFTPNLLAPQTQIRHSFFSAPVRVLLICIPPPCSFIINLQVERRGEAVEQRGGWRRGGTSLPPSALDLLDKSYFAPISERRRRCALAPAHLLLPYL